MEPSPTPDEPVTRIRVREALHTGPPTSAPSPGDGGGIEIAFYPDRVARPSTPPELTPSQALRFADDPGRVAAAAETAGSRTTVTPSTPPRHPQVGESQTPPADVNPPVPDVPDEAPGVPEEAPVAHDQDQTAVRGETDDVRHTSERTAEPHTPSRSWSVTLGSTTPPRPSWWRRMLRRDR